MVLSPFVEYPSCNFHLFVSFSGFIRFLGPYYMLLITKRRQIGAIYGQNVYAISKSEMIPLPNPAVLSNMTIDNKNESRLYFSLILKFSPLTTLLFYFILFFSEVGHPIIYFYSWIFFPIQYDN